MKNKKYYESLVYPITYSTFMDEGERVYKAEMRDLPGLVIYGDSYPEVFEEIKLAKSEWIEFNLDLGRDIPKPKNKNLTQEFISSREEDIKTSYRQPKEGQSWHKMNTMSLKNSVLAN